MKNDWPSRALGAFIAVPEPSLPRPCRRPGGRFLWVDASRLRQPGGTGNHRRLPRAYEPHGWPDGAGACGRPSPWGETPGAARRQVGEAIVADRGDGDR